MTVVLPPMQCGAGSPHTFHPCRTAACCDPAWARARMVQRLRNVDTPDRPAIVPAALSFNPRFRSCTE